MPKFNINNEGFRQQWIRAESGPMTKKKKPKSEKKVKVDWKTYATELANQYIVLHKKVTHLVHLLAEEYNWSDEQIEELIETTRTEFQNFKEPVAEFMKKLVKEDDPHNAD